MITGIEAVSIDLKVSIHYQPYKASESLFNSSTIANLSSIYNPVTAKSISLDSRAKPVIRDPNISNLGFSPANAYVAISDIF